MVANLVHRLSNRNEGPFIAINCGAIPTELMESELFGHKKGSFTGATQDKQGLIQSAHGGSLFLDEIAELPLSMQVKLLRAVQEKRIRPVGSDTEIDVDFRVISASHQDLDALVQQGKFRQDLFFRIHVMDLVLPPCVSAAKIFCSSLSILFKRSVRNGRFLRKTDGTEQGIFTRAILSGQCTRTA